MIQLSKNTSGKSAFSLLEILVAVALFAIVVATIVPTFSRSRASTKGTAQAIAAALSEARQRAIAEQVPVAFVIPSGGGTSGQASSYYIVSGAQPRVSRVRVLDSEQPNIRLMVGHWPLDASALRMPSLVNTKTPPPEAIWDNDFDLDQWGLPNPNDFAFVFTPRGKLVTNDLPNFDGNYHLVVSHGGSSSAATLAGTGVMSSPPTLFGLNDVGSPYTINLDVAGTVTVSKGLKALLAGGVTVSETAPLGSVPAAPSPDPAPTNAPVIVATELLPDPAKLNLPSGVDMLLSPESHLTLKVRASSPDKAPLFCRWTTTSGGVSSAERVPMTYLPASGVWEGTWQWTPPETVSTGDQITLQGEVSDAFGHSTSVTSFATGGPLVQIGSDTEIFVFNTGTINGDIFMQNTDGTRQRQLTLDPSTDQAPQLSPDGKQILFRSHRTGNHDLFVMNADGTGQRNLTNQPGSDWYASWSPNGSKILYYSDGLTPAGIYVMNADGSAKTFLSSGYGYARWSPDGSKIVFTADLGSGAELHVMNSDGTGVVQLTNVGGSPSMPAWSPDGTQIAFGTDRHGPLNREIYLMNADGSGQTRLTNASGFDMWPRWSPDGLRIAYTSEATGWQHMHVMDPDGSNDLDIAGTTSNAFDNHAWTQDSTRILATVSGLNSGVHIMDADGSNKRDLTGDPTPIYYGPQVR